MWDGAKKAGINGMVSVVVSLLWWGLGLPEGNTADRTSWLDAVDDVAWALDQMRTISAVGEEDSEEESPGVKDIPKAKGRKSKGYVHSCIPVMFRC